MKIAICGTGPSAAYAVLACKDAGAELKVFSDRVPHFEQSGAFFLHWLPEPFAGEHGIEPIDVLWKGFGTAEGYSNKMWGKSIPTSFPEVSRVERMYMSTCLKAVWDEIDIEVGRICREDLLELSGEFDFVFHTFPVAIKTLQMFPVVDYLDQIERSPRIIYEGGSIVPWVRSTWQSGRTSFEFPSTESLGEDPTRDLAVKTGIARIGKLRDIPPEVKPVRPEEYLAPHIVPIGRFATWDRKKLSHDAYKDVVEVIDGLR